MFINIKVTYFEKKNVFINALISKIHLQFCTKNDIYKKKIK